MFDFSESYTPLILPCGHTLCEQCVEKIKKECSNDGESYNSKSYCSYFQRKFENTNFEEFDYDISLISDDEKNFNDKKIKKIIKIIMKIIYQILKIMKKLKKEKKKKTQMMIVIVKVKMKNLLYIQMMIVRLLLII